MIYLNNALASSMIPDGVGLRPAKTLSRAQVVEILFCPYTHAGNPSHAPTWDAAARLIGLRRVREPQGWKVKLFPGDSVVVVEVEGLPRETREFTDEEVSRATISFRYFEAYSE